MLATKAFICFAGSTISDGVVLAQENIGVLRRESAGVYTLFFTTPIPGDYLVFATCKATPAGGVFVAESGQFARTPNSVTIVCFNGFATGVDPLRVSVEIKVKE